MKKLLIAALTSLSLVTGIYAAGQKEKTDKKPAAKEEASEKKEDGKKEEKKDDHDHEHAKAGPTGGKLITDVEPHVEFFVNKDKKVEIRFVDDDNKVVAPAAQEISVTLGERSKPTKLTFAKSGDMLVSDKTVPAGNDYPTIVAIKEKAGAKAVNVKFNLNMTKCPTCEFAEYACVCDHDAEEHEHKDGEKKDEKKDEKKTDKKKDK